MAIKIQHDKQGNVVAVDIKTNKILGGISGMEKDIPPPKKVKSKTPQ